MDKIIFVDYQTKITALWLNTVSDTVWGALGQASTPQEARQFIGAVGEAPNDGKPYLRASLGWVLAENSLAHNQLGGRSVSDAHPTSAIAGLDAALAGKAEAVHGHAISDVSGLQTALDGKQPSLPSQAGQGGQYLTTDGINLNWEKVDALPDQAGHAGEFLTTNGTDPSWVSAQANKTEFGLFEHAHTIDANYSILAGNNAISGGPVTISNGVAVTVPDGSTWTIT